MPLTRQRVVDSFAPSPRGPSRPLSPSALRSFALALSFAASACDGPGSVTRARDGGAGADASACTPEPANFRSAPEFSTGLTWLNTDHPWTMAELRGQVVLLDFWTYGCVNCLNQAPTIAELENMYEGRPFVVIGVHSAKFSNEKDADNIELAIQEYGIRHPVVDDENLAIWNAYKVSAWPTGVIVDAEGKLRYSQTGEYSVSLAAGRITPLIDQAECLGVAGAPLSYLRNPTAAATTPLLFPTGVLALPDGRVAISDSSHDRVVLMQSEGAVGSVFGSGIAGFDDGDADSAEFSGPEGLTVSGTTLYVADAGNHAVRAIDLGSGVVSTVAGTGAPGSHLTIDEGWIPATANRLNMPSDLESTSSGIVIALAGTNQLALFDPAGARFRLFSGNGTEGLIDGDSGSCEYAQPSALSQSADGTTLYVADPESSAVRSVNLSDGSCTTLVGHGLSKFGDQDGVGSDVLLQHVSGIETLATGDLLLADTYNSKIKELVPSTRTVTTADWPSPDLATNQPRGISRLGSLVYVADTNHHRILVYDLDSDDTHVFDTGDLAPPALPGDAGAFRDASVDAGSDASPAARSGDGAP